MKALRNMNEKGKSLRKKEERKEKSKKLSNVKPKKLSMIMWHAII
jgi:hypothetical protein